MSGKKSIQNQNLKKNIVRGLFILSFLSLSSSIALVFYHNLSTAAIISGVSLLGMMVMGALSYVLSDVKNHKVVSLANTGIDLNSSLGKEFNQLNNLDGNYSKIKKLTSVRWAFRIAYCSMLFMAVIGMKCHLDFISVMFMVGLGLVLFIGSCLISNKIERDLLNTDGQFLELLCNISAQLRQSEGIELNTPANTKMLFEIFNVVLNERCKCGVKASIADLADNLAILQKSDHNKFVIDPSLIRMLKINQFSVSWSAGLEERVELFRKITKCDNLEISYNDANKNLLADSPQDKLSLKCVRLVDRLSLDHYALNLLA